MKFKLEADLSKVKDPEKEIRNALIQTEDFIARGFTFGKLLVKENRRTIQIGQWEKTE